MADSTQKVDRWGKEDQKGDFTRLIRFVFPADTGMLILPAGNHHDKLFKQVLLEMVHHLFLHDFQPFEGLHFLAIRSVRRQGVIDIGNRADLPIDM